MRYINQARVVPPRGWEDDARQALIDVENGTKDIKKLGKIWAATKDTLHAASGGKCWYCESIQERSDDAVDHFRPKSLYWWLAFDLSNYRYACTYCNSKRRDIETGKTGGKGDEFPLFNEAERAKKQGEEARELPVLIDPCVIRDVGLLDFREIDVCARHKDNPNKKKRADDSIKLYNLNHSGLRGRRTALAAKIRTLIKTGDALFPQCECGDPDVDAAFDGVANELANTMVESSEDTAFAKSIIQESQGKEWVKEILNYNIL